MNPSRREILGTLAAAGTAMLVEPGEVLAGLVADVPCVSGGPAGELLGTLPLFRNRVVPGQFGVKYDGVGLDARLDTDLSLLEPNNLITPERARVHPHRDSRGGRQSPGPVDARHQRPAREPRRS